MTVHVVGTGEAQSYLAKTKKETTDNQSTQRERSRRMYGVE